MNKKLVFHFPPQRVKWPNSSQHQRMTPRTSMGSTSWELSCAGLEIILLWPETCGVTDQNLRTGLIKSQDVVLVLSLELWIKLCLEPVLPLCVNKVDRHRCLSIFVKIFMMTSQFCQDFWTSTRPNIHKIVVHIHRARVCLFILHSYRGLHIKVMLHLQNHNQNTDIKKNVLYIRF